ncbi:hypothetical protein [Treponema pectinovorum]|uniref:hypothetical protein n=1 Tax=Treponema pectinovorum TaxID=164 RepID=UPI0011F3EE9B|nr:hypothetical protein [Treponema pectinovorum]
MAELTQWEYKKIPSDIDELQKLGEQGWEAAGTFSNSGGGNQILLKRPMQKQPPRDFDYGSTR